MARGRLRFSTEVPDQLVVLDPNLAAVDDQYVRVLQRYKDLLRESGAMDERDVAVMDSDSAAPSTSTSGLSKGACSHDVFKVVHSTLRPHKLQGVSSQNETPCVIIS